jgi:hypothetical protein
MFKEPRYRIPAGFEAIPSTGHEGSQAKYPVKWLAVHLVPESEAAKLSDPVKLSDSGFAVVDSPPSECRNLAELADKIERAPGRKRNRVIRLLRLMAKQDRATHAEVIDQVFEGYPAEWSTVEDIVRQAQKEIGIAQLAVGLGTSDSTVLRYDPDVTLF